VVYQEVENSKSGGVGYRSFLQPMFRGLVALMLCSVVLMIGADSGAKAQTAASTDERIDAMMRELQALKSRQARQQQQIEAQNRLIARQTKELQAQKRQTAARAFDEETAQVVRGEGKTEARLQTTSTGSYPTPAPRRTAPRSAASGRALENVVTGGSKKGSFRLPGSSTSIKVSGYVKADALYDVDYDTGDYFVASRIPVKGDPLKTRKGSFRAHARQSRLRFQSWTPTPLGEFATHIEGDFYGATGEEGFANSSGFRLRQAYGRLGPLLAGQTWSLFMDLNSHPTTIDFFGPSGIPFDRQGQVRLTAPLAPGTTFAISAENSEFIGHADNLKGADGIAANALIGSESYGLKMAIDVAPDVVAALEHKGDMGSIRLAGVTRFFDTDTLAMPQGKAVGWGFHLSGSLKTFGRDRIIGGYSYGQGLGRYLLGGYASDATINTETGDISPDEEWGVYAAYQHFWSDNWSSNFVYGREENPDALASSTTLKTSRKQQTAHANIIYTPIPGARLGLEYIYGERENVDGKKGDARRVQFGAMWSLN